MLTHTRTLWLIYGSHRHTSSCNVHFSRVVLLTFDFHFKNGVWAAAYNCKERPSLIKVIRHWQPGGRGLLGSSFKCFLTFFLRVNLFLTQPRQRKRCVDCQQHTWDVHTLLRARHFCAPAWLSTRAWFKEYACTRKTQRRRCCGDHLLLSPRLVLS